MTNKCGFLPAAVAEYAARKGWETSYEETHLGPECELTGVTVQYSIGTKTRKLSLVTVKIRNKGDNYLVEVDVHHKLANVEEDDTYGIWDYINDNIVNMYKPKHGSSGKRSATELSLNSDDLLDFLKFLDATVPSLFEERED